MQKTFSRESYALSPGEELSSLLTEKCVPVIKKPVMITLLPERFFKNVDFVDEAPQMAMRYIAGERPAKRYYSLLLQLYEPSNSFSMAVRDESKNVIRISLVNMTVHELYLFALDMRADFPTDQILVLGEQRDQLVPCDELRKSPSYCYELAVPASTAREEYLQRILMDLNNHFKLDVRVEKITIVKGSHEVVTIHGESIELIWEEQLMMIMKSRPEATSRVKERELALSM